MNDLGETVRNGKTADINRVASPNTYSKSLKKALKLDLSIRLSVLDLLGCSKSYASEHHGTQNRTR